MYNFKYGRKMKQKIFIMASKDKIEICIEYNVIDNKANINWICDRTTGHDKFKDTLGDKKDQQVIQQAMEYAKELKQYTEIINKYN